MSVELAIALISTLVGGVLSFVFGYFPRLSDWFYGLSTLARFLVTAGLNAVVAVGIYLAACYLPFVSVPVEYCSTEGIRTLVIALFFLLVGSHGLVLPVSKAKLRALLLKA